MYYTDPVCKKKIRKKQEHAIIKFRGIAYHLCCASCKDNFIMRPEEYVPQNEIVEDDDTIN